MLSTNEMKWSGAILITGMLVIGGMGVASIKYGHVPKASCVSVNLTAFGDVERNLQLCPGDTYWLHTFGKDSLRIDVKK